MRTSRSWKYCKLGIELLLAIPQGRLGPGKAGAGWYHRRAVRAPGDIGREVLNYLHPNGLKLQCVGLYTLVNYVVQTLTLAKSLKTENFTTKEITEEKYHFPIQNRDE